MFFQFIRSKKERQTTDGIDSIKKMLDSTWDLAAQFHVHPGSRHASAITLFNRFFNQLNQVITTIVKNVVQLSELSPELFSFSKNFKKKAEKQGLKISDIARSGQAMADQVEKIANNIKLAAQDSEEIQKEVHTAKCKGESSMKRFAQIKHHVTELAETIRVLDNSSKSISSIIDVINNIADETNILSLNARIEAARDTVDGKGFKVIAEEVAALAKQSKKATKDIQDRLTVLGDTVEETVTAVQKVEENVASGEKLITDANESLWSVHEKFKRLTQNMADVETSTMLQSDDIKSISQDITCIEDIVKEQTSAVETILTTAGQVNTTCKKMIIDTGIFHLTSHYNAKTAVEKFALSPELSDTSKEITENILAQYLKKNSFIELAYITDGNGRQITDNIYSEAIEKQEELEKGFNQDWSNKEWFKTPSSTGQTFVSKVYQSSATDQFCFTIAVPLFRSEKFYGVLGIDIHFKDILGV